MIEVSATIEARRTVTIQPKIAGRVLTLNLDEVDEGKTVEIGAPLLCLDAAEAQAALEQAKAQKEQVEALLADRKLQLDLQELEREARTQRVRETEIERDRLEAQVRRNEELDPDLVSPQQAEEDRLAMQAAEVAVTVADINLQKHAVELALAEQAVKELEARVKIETKRVDAEQLRVDEHEITAPISGVISERLVEQGQTVATTTSLFTIVDTSELIAYLQRPQRELPIVRTAKSVRFTTDAVPDHTFEASVDVLLPIVDVESGSFRLRVRVTDDEYTHLLRPGMFVRATILTEDDRDALMVPKQAVLNDGVNSIVYVVRDGIAERVVLQPGVEERSFIESTDRGANGLQPEDRVVISGHSGLRDKIAVEEVEE